MPGHIRKLHSLINIFIFCQENFKLQLESLYKLNIKKFYNIGHKNKMNQEF